MQDDVIKMVMEVISTQNSSVKCIQYGGNAGFRRHHNFTFILRVALLGSVLG